LMNAIIYNFKKNDGDKICFILLDEIWKTIITYRKIDEIKNLLEKIIKKLFYLKK
jgi:hypothetical protein